MNYPIVIHKDRKSDYGVTVPDLPGCFSAGRTIDEAIDLAAEAIVLHIEGIIEEGLPLPQPRPISEHQKNPDYTGGVWAVVPIHESKLPLKFKRINITMPQRVLDAVDRYARERGQTRSGLLTRAAAEFVRQSRQASPRPRDRRRDVERP